MCDTALVAQADPDDFDDELERLRSERHVAELALQAAWAQSPAVLVKGGDREELWILSGETSPKEGKIRVTELLPDGPYGHFSAETIDEIVREKANTWSTYTPVDEQFVMDWTSTDEWHEGLQRVAYVQAHNQLTYLAGSKHWDWAWGVISKARAEPDIERATRMLEQAAADLQAGRAPNPTAIRRLKRRLLRI